MEEGVIDDESVWSRGVKRGKVSVPWHTSIEIGIGEGSCVKGGSINGSMLCPLSLQRNAIS